jgi:hypothetical protein
LFSGAQSVREVRERKAHGLLRRFLPTMVYYWILLSGKTVVLEGVPGTVSAFSSPVFSYSTARLYLSSLVDSVIAPVQNTISR